jgi:hypothetical protein
MHSLNTIKQQNKSNAKKLIDLTLKNGGVSFNNNLQELPFKTGFAVAHEEVDRFTTSLSTGDLELEKALNKLPALNPDEFYGLCLENHTIQGEIYDSYYILDKVRLIMNYDSAVRYGRKYGQKSIYDFKHGIEIKLEGGK